MELGDADHQDQASNASSQAHSPTARGNGDRRRQGGDGDSSSSSQRDSLVPDAKAKSNNESSAERVPEETTAPTENTPEKEIKATASPKEGPVTRGRFNVSSVDRNTSAERESIGGPGCKKGVEAVQPKGDDGKQDKENREPDVIKGCPEPRTPDESTGAVPKRRPLGEKNDLKRPQVDLDLKRHPLGERSKHQETNQLTESRC